MFKPPFAPPNTILCYSTFMNLFSSLYLIFSLFFLNRSFSYLLSLNWEVKKGLNLIRRQLKNNIALPFLFQIPLLNCTESHNLLDGTLVRFRGMVQDIRNPEFFFDKFKVYNTVTKETTTRSGKYRDICTVSVMYYIIFYQRHTTVKCLLPFN